jgi:Protein of unknown function (DUF2892)
MKQNMGNADRIIRVLAAMVIAVLYFSNAVSGLCFTWSGSYFSAYQPCRLLPVVFIIGNKYMLS